jgi:hypothetical protein
MTQEYGNNVDRLRDQWINGGTARPLIEELIRLKRMNEAATLARLVLASHQCCEREVLEKLLERTGSPPPGWSEAVAAFALEPTVEGWDALMCFTPNEVFYQRTRNTLRALRLNGTNPNILFRCATRCGTVPDAFELVQSGEVDPETVVMRAQEAPPEARALWLGIAAEAAFARGDDLGTVRLLQKAFAEAAESIGPEMSARAIRAKASLSLHAMLDKAGIGRFEEEF